MLPKKMAQFSVSGQGYMKISSLGLLFVLYSDVIRMGILLVII